MRGFVKIVALVALGAATSMDAAIITEWTYETSQPSASGVPIITGVSAEIGVGTALGFHLLSTTWASLMGNGSAHSFSANSWTIGDYFQFQTSTLGYQNITVTWDQYRSGTGPAGFELQYSTDGVLFSDAYAFSPGTTSWSSDSHKSDAACSYDFGSVPDLNNAPNVYFRLAATSSGGTGAGTSRNDNFAVSGDIIPVPEPDWLYPALALAVVCVLRAWRSRHVSVSCAV